MRRVASLFAVVCVALTSGAQPQARASAVDELVSEQWLSEVVRYLYRWYIDERDLDAVVHADEVVFWVRELTPELDPDDRSAFGEVVLPQFSMSVRVKRADYDIPELDTSVRDRTFRVTRVSRIDPPDRVPEGMREVRVVYSDMRDELFRTRHLASFPEGELFERIREGVRAELDASGRADEAPDGTQIVHLAPLSPVANETWLFWESGRCLIRVASDMDLSNPDLWKHEELVVRLYPIDDSVVVSLDEVAGSNAYMTRDHAGRVLYNCIVLGKRIELTPPD